MVPKRKLFTVSVLALLFLSMFGGLGVWQIKPFASAQTSPLFGYDTIGSTEDNMPTGYKLACGYTAPVSGNITAILAYIAGYQTAAVMKLAVYSDSSFAPSALLGTSSEKTVSSSLTWVAFNFSTLITFTIEITYWFSVMANVTLLYRYNTGSSNQEQRATNSYGTFSNPYGTPYMSTARKPSFYADYVQIGASTIVFKDYITTNTTLAGKPAMLSLNVSSSQTPAYCVFETNNTGPQANGTIKAVTPVNSTFGICSETLTWNSSYGHTVLINVYANDSGGWSKSNPFYFYLRQDNNTMALHATDRNLYNANGTQVYLRGAQAGDFAGRSDGGFTGEFGVDMDTFISPMVSMNMTAIRICIMANWWIDNFTGYKDWYANYTFYDHEDVSYTAYRTTMYNYLYAARQYGIYVVVSMWDPDNDRGTKYSSPIPSDTFPDSETFVDFWVNFTNEYKTFDNLIIEPFNEPAANYTTNMGAFQQMANAIRNVGYDNIINIQWLYTCYQANTGNSFVENWADSWVYQSLPLFANISNIMYGAHLYPAQINTHQPLPDNSTIDNAIYHYHGLANATTIKRPLFCGEINYATYETNGSIIIARSFVLFNLENVSYTGFIWLNSSAPSAYALVTGSFANPTLTEQGSLLVNAINNFGGGGSSVTLTVSSPANTTYTTPTISVQLSASGGTIDTILWNCTFTNGTVAYANTVYTVPTSMTLGNGSYIFNAWANNTDGNWDEETVTFTVAIPATSSSTIGYQLGQGTIAAAGFMAIVMLLGMVYVAMEGKDVKYAVMLAVGEVLLLVTMLILSQLAVLG